MRTIRWARGMSAALLISIAGTSCREMAPPTGVGRVAPTSASFAIASVLTGEAEQPLIPIRTAQVRLFRLPGENPERAVLDTVVPFDDAVAESALTLGIVLTMVSERFGLELSLLDDHQQVVYRGRDTVIAYTAARPQDVKTLRLRYVGADTAVARITLAIDDAEIPLNEPTPLRVGAFLRDGRATSARFGFAVHGSPAITVDAAGVLRASAPVPPGAAWVVARLATGMADSIAVSAVVPAASIELRARGGRVAVGDRLVVDAVARDAGGVVLAGRRLAWSSSNAGVATVVDGVVTGKAVGTAVIEARSGRASATTAIRVGPATVARVAPSVFSLTVVEGRSVQISAQPEDSGGALVPGHSTTWTSADPGIASVTPNAVPAGAPVTVRGLHVGTTSIVVEVDGVRARVPVTVTFAPAGRVTIAPRSLALMEGSSGALSAVVLDAGGAVQAGRVVSWRSLDPSVATVDANGVVRAKVGGTTSIVASVDAVADTVPVVARRVTSLSITRVGTVVDSRGEVATFVVSAFDQFGALIDNPTAQWSVTPNATLLTAAGSQAQVVLQRERAAVLTASARGLTVSISLMGATASSMPGRER